MKKLSFALFLVLVLVGVSTYPVVTNAAWWNPLSWFSNWQFSTPVSDTKTQILENRIMELEKKLENTATSTAIIATTTKIKASSVTKIDTVSTKQKNNTDIPSAPLIKVIDIQITNFGSVLDYANAYSETIDYYKNLATKSMEANQLLIEREGDASLLKMWKWNSDLFTAIIDLCNAAKDNNSKRIQALNIAVDFLKREKDLLPTSVTQEFYSSKAKELGPNLGLAQLILTQTHDSQAEFLDVMGKSQSKFSEEKADIESYMASLRSLRSSIQVPVYQPVILPQIQMPKTTYCNMNETGARNFYSITCNTY